MAEDIFLKLDGIKGESKQKGFSGQIEIASFSWGASNTPAPVGAKGQFEVDDVIITKQVDSTSPKFLELCADGSVVKNAVFSWEKSDSKGAELTFMKMKVSDMSVASWEMVDAGGASTEPTEKISFTFQKIEMDFYPPSATVPVSTTVVTPVEPT